MLAGASVLALTMASERAFALELNGAWLGSSTTTTNYAAQAAQGAAKAQAEAAARSQESMDRAISAMQNLTRLQSAARAVAAGQTGGVPNGLTPGGLVPAVTAPTRYTDDPTGVLTWDGAALPTQTQTSSGITEVTVKQLDPQAILSWSSFNVGRNTLLNFDQQGNSSWTVLNRIVEGTAPSQILGAIHSDGTVLVINRNGIIFGGASQINVGSLISSTLDIGVLKTTTTYQSNQFFKQPTTSVAALSYFGADKDGVGIGDIVVQPGARVETTPAGQIILMGHHVTNAGTLSSPEGQVILAAGDSIFFTKNTGDAQSADPNVRGLLTTVRPSGETSSWASSSFYVHNTVGGIVAAERGNITLATGANISGGDGARLAEGGAILNEGLLWSTTSVSRNGSIILSGGDIDIAGTGVLAIAADTNGETIPQDPTSLGAFKPSEILIGDSPLSNANVALQSGAFIYAPSATVKIGNGGVTTIPDPVNGGQGTPSTGNSNNPTYATSTFIDSGVVIDVSGLTDVTVPASRNEVTIGPVKGNELRDSPLLRAYFNGVTVYLDPRKSGVRADGVAWIGSPLIDAAAYYQLFGVSVAELMTKGGDVSIAGGAGSRSNRTPLGGVVINSGAIINVSGGWVNYEGGMIRESLVIDANGRLVTMSNADPSNIYLGVYNGFTVDHSRWGFTETFKNPLLPDSHFEAGYSEGRDAGSLRINASTASLNQTLIASSYAGYRQTIDSKTGTAASSIANDRRALQGAPSQLPAGGLLSVAVGVDINVTNRPPAPVNVVYGAPVQIGADGSYTAPSPQAAAASTTVNSPLEISDKLTTQSGLSQLALASSGSITVSAGANVVLQPGGAFTASSGRQINIDGSITAPGGKIDLKTGDGGIGSLLTPSTPAIGSFDINVTGSLSVSGLWVNEFQNPPNLPQNHAWLDAGTISMFAASNLLVTQDGQITTGGRNSDPPQGPVTDVSGSIIIDPRARLGLTSGGRIDRFGITILTAKGGNLSLRSATAYFQTLPPNGFAGSGFDVDNVIDSPSGPIVVDPIVSPSQINTRITFDPSSIEAHGFGGGGTFTLQTPQITIGEGATSLGTDLPLDFFSKSGFATFNITSAKTALLPSSFNNGHDGYNALLQTQTITIKSGEVLSLNQSMLPTFLNLDQTASLRQLASGGDVTSVLDPIIPTIAWDQRAVSLNFGGLVELHVAKGGAITGAAGSSIRASKVFNEGTIRIAGGTILQQEVLPPFYGSGNGGVAAGAVNPYLIPAIGIRSLGDVFSVKADGTIDVNALSKVNRFNITTGTYTTELLTNGDLAGNFASGAATPIYLLGRLDADQGIVLSRGSVTDLSGTVLTDPRALLGSQPMNVGRTVAGGMIATAPTTADLGTSYLGVNINHSWVAPRTLVAEAGARIDLSGVSTKFDFVGVPGPMTLVPRISQIDAWSDGGALIASNGATLTGAIIDAHGGSSSANGGELAVYTPILVAHDPAAPTANVISADMIAKAGFDSVMAIGSVSSSGDVTLNLRNKFILQGVTFDTADKRLWIYGTNGVNATDALVVPQVRSDGGTLTINAGYIGLQSTIDRLDPVSEVNIGTPGDGSVIFNAGAIDVTGAVLFDRSVANATLATTGDLRLIGIQPWQLTYSVNGTTAPALNGALAVNGDLNLTANRIYPTTGSTFAVTSAATDGTITIGRVGNANSGVPYSAGGNLSFAAAHIVDGGNIRVPFGTLTLGSSTAVTGSTSGMLAPATQSVTLLAGSITGVSADGLTIPYGTTTDLKEWYFAPTSGTPITGPPEKILRINASDITIESGATVDISGGGDLYTYEFVAGTGGSHDVLSRFNSDPFSGNDGFQYPDHRQVYAIVPELSNAPVAAYDPIYSADYSSISTGSLVGTRVYLSAAPGLSAGWYTLLPAQYAMLPGGMRVVEQTGTVDVLPGLSQQTPDGSLFVSGHYGNAIAGTSQSQERLFSVQDQATFLQYSNIVTTSGNANAVIAAVKAGSVLPQIGLDAGRLVLNPSVNLAINAAINTAAAPGGRGAVVDIGGRAFDIVSDLAQAPDDGAIHLTASSLQNLNASSLLIGGFRTDNADGTTTLTVTAQSIIVANDAAHPVTASEIILAVDDLYDNSVASSLVLKDGATLIAKGELGDTRNGNYIIDGTQRSVDPTTGAVTNPIDSGHGALVRVANGPQRLVLRKIDPNNAVPEATLEAGAAVLSGTDLMLDSSDQNHLASGLVLQNNQRVAVSAKSIGFGADPTQYAGLVITNELKNTLSANGADITLRSQTSIDFAGGTYDLNNINFDTAALSNIDGRDVTINGNKVGLGNIGAATDCASCQGTDAKLAINAKEILFTGGAVSLKGATLDTNVPAILAADATATLPAGTVLHDPNGFDRVLSSAATIIIPKGTSLTAMAGLGLSLGIGADGTSAVKSGGQVTASGSVSTEFPVGQYRFTSDIFVVSSNGTPQRVPAGTFGLDAGTAKLSPGSVLSLTADATVTRRSFFAGGVELTGQTGIFASGKGCVFDAGAARVSLVTPLLSDRAVTGLSNESPYALTFKTAGDLSVARGTLASVDPAGIAGVPGSAITLIGNNIGIDATYVRATAGTLSLQAAAAISVQNGATLAAPGYTKTFGDSADPQVRSSAGGAVTLTAASGDIVLGDALLSVAGGNGTAGTLTLSAASGAIDLSQVRLDGSGKDNGGKFVYSAESGVDADDLNTLANTAGFTGGFDLSVAHGDLTLGAGETLRSAQVSLTANDGTVAIAGTIDTSGVNGGDISLYGRQSVVLEDTAVLRARATGYGTFDTRQAKGGDVVLGTDLTSATTHDDGTVTGTSGVIDVKAGAVIDVAAARPGDRLVPFESNGQTVYQLVQGDMGGTLSFRAPVVLDPSGHQTVNVNVADAKSVVGARSVKVEAFQRWDLQQVAESGKYVGVTCSTSPCTGANAVVTLDVRPDLDTANVDGTRTVVGGVNFLGDNGVPGAATVADFIQTFDLSSGSAYGRLGGLAGQTNFHAQPGVDLFASGDVVMASNWNLGAGTVDLAAAKNAGDVTINPSLQVAGMPTSGYVVTPGREASIFQNYTTMIYRTGQSVAGDAPIVTLRGSGNLTFQGSVSDGTFLFRDQTDQGYLSQLQIRDKGFVASTAGFYIGTPGQKLVKFSEWDGQDFYTFGTNNYLALALFGAASGNLIASTDFNQIDKNQAPYSALGNSPAALTAAGGNAGDPLGSAIVFPLLADNKAASSSSYRFVAGASGASASEVSVDPNAIDRSSKATLSLQGLTSYSYYNSQYPVLLSPDLFIDTSYDVSFGIGGFVDPSDRKTTFAAWLASVTNSSKYSDDALAIVYVDDGLSGDSANRALVTSAFARFAQDRGLQEGTDYRLLAPLDSSAPATLSNTQYIALSGKNFKDFTQNYLIPISAQLAANLFKSETTSGYVPSVNVPVQSVIRTGTGAISLAASSNVDLRGSADPIYFDQSSGVTAQPTEITSQLGGGSVYTLGRRADPTTATGTKTLVDPISGVRVTIDLSSGFGALGAATVFANPTNGGPDTIGKLAVDPVILADGGDVVISAGANVQGRFSAYFHLNPNSPNAVNPHPWDVTESGFVFLAPDGRLLTAARSGIAPQLFREGLGALGGGDIRVEAGGDVSDVTVAVDGAAVYGNAISAGGGTTGAALRFGGGNAIVLAGGDIVGGRLDLASGTALLTAGGDVRSASYLGSSNGSTTSFDIGLDIAANDATVAVAARGAVTLASMQALGGGGNASQTIYQSNAPLSYFTINSYAPTSGLGISANDDVAITNRTYVDAGGNVQFAPIYPGSLTIDAINGSISLPPLLMNPSAEGQLRLYAGWDLDPTAVAMLDNASVDGLGMSFPAVLPNSSSTYLASLHNPDITHKNDPYPVYVYAANDLRQVTLSLPKQARVWAGRDIVDMVFFGQNLAANDITRIVAGRDITATTRVIAPQSVSQGVLFPDGTPQPAFQGNTFVIGGPGTFMLEAGRDLGPFLNSAVAREQIRLTSGQVTTNTDTFFGGVISVGNLWNPYLPSTGSDIDILFGVAKGADFNALRDAYLAPGTAANAVGDYSAKLIAWMQANQAQKLETDFGTTNVTANQAYAAFLELPTLQQRRFLIGEVYFNELSSTADTTPAVYERGYRAVNTLFPASLGYTANSLDGGSNGALRSVSTGDLDLRLATVETQFGGSINILGPGGNIIAGSVVATSVQAARRSYQGYNLYSAAPLDFENPSYRPFYNSAQDPVIGVGRVLSIPQGGEGILTLRGGDINTFTDASLLINQSRLFTEGGGDIVLWSSNGDLNAGQGPKTSANFPPIVVTIDDYGHTTVNQSGSVTGAGIAALTATPDAPASNVDLIAPRGTVDAGDAGVRVSGNLSVAALTVVNANNFQVSGASVGIPTISVPSLSLGAVGNAAAAATKSVEATTASNTPAQASIIIVEFLGYGGGDAVEGNAPVSTSGSDADDRKKRQRR